MYSAVLLILTVLFRFLLLVVTHSALFASYLPYIFLIVYVGAIIVVIGYVCSVTPLVINSNLPYLYVLPSFIFLCRLSSFFFKADLYPRVSNYSSFHSCPSDFIFHQRFIFFFIIILFLLLFILLVASRSVPAHSTLRRVNS